VFAFVRMLDGPGLRVCGGQVLLPTSVVPESLDLLTEGGVIAAVDMPSGSQTERGEVLDATAACVTASHDSPDSAGLERDLRLGVSIAEFPFTVELARQYIDHGLDVVLGAPNLVRGRSHLGHLSVRAAVAAQAATMLCSDYHYPSLLRAPFTLVDLGICPLAEAWRLVSATPARAAGLTDRGRLEVGARADIVVVEPPSADQGPRVRSVVVDGRPVYRTAGL